MSLGKKYGAILERVTLSSHQSSDQDFCIPHEYSKFMAKRSSGIYIWTTACRSDRCPSRLHNNDSQRGLIISRNLRIQRLFKALPPISWRSVHLRRSRKSLRDTALPGLEGIAPDPISQSLRVFHISENMNLEMRCYFDLRWPYWPSWA